MPRKPLIVDSPEFADAFEKITNAITDSVMAFSDNDDRWKMMVRLVAHIATGMRIMAGKKTAAKQIKNIAEALKAGREH